MVIPTEKILKEEFGKYGEVKLVFIKQAQGHSGLRSYAFVEMANHEQSKRVYKKFMRENHGERRHRLGDKRCELSILVKSNKKYGNGKINLLYFFLN